ncbi:MAG TPA: hypothetical protein VGV59_19200 [Pyrinomonadaceae bacterium]|nr:hypothetical protein [Pyrinomonadaceae bacterium]
MLKAMRVFGLLVVLAYSVQAGVILTPPAPQPPPPQSETAEQEPEGGEIECGQPETVTQIVLTLLNNALSLF